MAHTVTSFLTDIREDARLKDSSPSDAALLSLANRFVQGFFTQLVQGVQQNYGLTQETFAITANTTAVTLPARAFMSRLTSVRFYAGTDSTVLNTVAHVSYGMAQEGPYQSMAFSLRDNELRLHNPLPGTLVVDYAYRPGQMVLPSTVNTLTNAVSAGATSLVIGTQYQSWNSGDGVDVILATAPHTLVHQTTVDNYSPNTLVVSDAMPSGLAAGTYICKREETPVVPLPYELYPALVVSVAAAIAGRVYEGGELAATLQQEASGLINSAREALRNRAENNPIQYVDWDNHFRRGGRGYRRYW